MKAPEHLKHALECMLHSLKTERLDVILVSNPNASDREKIRVVQNQNPEWYRGLCNDNPSSGKWTKKYSKFKTRISRKRIIEALVKLSSGEDSTSLYASELIEWSEWIVQEWEEERIKYEEQYNGE